MRRLIDLIKGWPGKPSHPPLTDASIGAYTVGVAMLVSESRSGRGVRDRAGRLVPPLGRNVLHVVWRALHLALRE
jgi:hypothetical protein